MSRWFRHYAGMMRDDKLVRVAIRSGQSVERVLWVWGAILESAAEIDDGGRFDFDVAEASYFLRASECDVVAVQDALAAAGRISDDTVVHWGERQFQSDKSASRTAVYRERKRAASVTGDDTKASRDADVTSQERHGDAPETETELDTEKNPATPLRRGKRAPRHDFDVPDWIPAEPWEAYCAMRKRKKAPVDGYIADKQFGKLAQYRDAGWDIAKVLDNATVKNWTDIYEPTPGRDDNLRPSSQAPASGKVWTAEQRAAHLAKMDRFGLSEAQPEPPVERSRRTQSIGSLLEHVTPQ